MGRKFKIKISRDLAWLIPYLDAVRPYVPLERLKCIRAYRAQRGKNVATDGSLICTGRRYTMTLRTHSRYGGKLCRRQLGNILHTFAHELAHLIEWEHTPAHFAFTSFLMIILSGKIPYQSYTRREIHHDK